ncbi:simple sugar transport system ATP-binding protein [Microbacterium ginsengiterrae]|uniref:Simple sugar transport system ATP-binding protein n=1 Tax=Microbacterium ginsengiterrae TaxID=546115 RepID=A0A7W9CCS1_9MICO|nr:sugar ABC transporter ATP-binding protein [Microbacterium ginsengiterrae]MBB5743205.1 simple sugar transport system ATP-binding protein [Microbacterium ginsengiterrae]
MGDNVIAVRGVSKAFAGVQALQDISLEIAPGEIHCLAGENGSGKSTLIKVISGVHSPDAGTVELGGETFTKLNPREAIAHGVQVIYQDFSVFPNLSVMENLALTAELSDGRPLVSWRRMRQVATQALEKIGVEIDLEARVGTLPVAQKQLVAIARALMSDARLIIMDEPTTALTRREVRRLFGIILDLKARGIATLFVSHKLEEVFEISERFTIIRNGKHVITCLPEELDRKSFSTYMTGREFDETRFAPVIEDASPVLEVSGLGHDNAFEDVDLSLRPGEILGITGLLGSGRTELALALFGALKAETGEIRINGETVHLNGVRSAIAHGIGYVPEDRLTEGLFLERSIGSNIVISEIDAFVSSLGVLDQRKADAEAQRWVDELRIATPDPENPVNTLSGGNQQRVVLAKWLATNPRVLILNGPTVGVDIGSKHDIHRVLRALAAEGLAVIIISDDIPEVLENCNRVLVMNAGRIVSELDPATTDEHDLAALMSEDVDATSKGA